MSKKETVKSFPVHITAILIDGFCLRTKIIITYHGLRLNHCCIRVNKCMLSKITYCENRLGRSSTYMLKTRKKVFFNGFLFCFLCADNCTYPSGSADYMYINTGLTTVLNIAKSYFSKSKCFF